MKEIINKLFGSAVRKIYRAIKIWKINASANQPMSVRCVTALELVNYHDFEHYNPEAVMNQTITVRYDSIRDFSKTVGYLSSLVRAGETIPGNFFGGEAEPRSVDRFVSIHNGRYVPVHRAVDEFRENALVLCKLMAVSTAGEGVGMHAYYERKLANHLNAIYELALVLVKAGGRF